MRRNEILCGDIIEIAKALATQSINCIITSPPYFGLRNYGLPPTYWPEVTYAPMDGLPSVTAPAISCCLGLEDSIQAYVGHIVLVFRELWRVLRVDGVAWLNLGDSYAGSWGNYGGQNRGNGQQREIAKGSKVHQKSYDGLENWRPPTADVLKPKNLIGIPWRVAFALQSDGWYLRSEVIWAKKNPMPESVTDRPTKAHEQVFLLTKKPRYWYDQEAIREKANYDGRNDTRMKGSTKLKNIPGQSPQSSALNGAERWPNKTEDGSPGRNARTVWSIATTPYKGSHFAVFPPKLVEKCLLVGCPSRVCVECGEPWVRVVERTKGDPESFKGSKFTNGKTAVAQNALSAVGQKPRTMAVKSLRFSPTCQCSASHRPGIVLDPFFGSGTVAQVAIETGRDWLGVELNPEYVKLAQSRINKTQPALFPV